MIRCNLAVLLAERNLKITKVALDTGISRNTLHLLANNRSQGIQFDTMNTLCLYLKVTPDKLFSFCPFDINIVDIGTILENDTETIYLITLSVYEHKKYFKENVFGKLKKLSTTEETYILSIEAYVMGDIDLSAFELSSSEIDLESYLKRIPRIFVNDLENNIIEKIYPDKDKDSFVIEWDLELPF